MIKPRAPGWYHVTRTYGEEAIYWDGACWWVPNSVDYLLTLRDDWVVHRLLLPFPRET